MSQASARDHPASVMLHQEEVYFDPVAENSVINNLAPSKEIVMHEESEPEEPEPDARTSSEVRSGVAAKINAARKFDIK